MKGAKELAGILRHMRDHLPLDDIQKGILRESAAHLDRLAAIDGAVPDDVSRIQERHRIEYDSQPDAIKRLMPFVNEDCATLLAIVQRKAGEIAELRAQLAISMDARLSADLTSARAEVERLTERLRMMQHGETEALKMMGAEKQRADNLSAKVERLMEQDKRTVADGLAVLNKLTDARCEVERLKSERAELALENARLVNEHAAAMSRADVLAEAICNADPIGWTVNGRIDSADAWQKMAAELIKGHMVSK